MCSSPAAPLESAACCASSAIMPARTASRSPSPPTPPTSTAFPPADQPPFPGSREIERRIKSLVRWNALAMVVKANKARGRHRRSHLDVRLGGHALRSRVQPLLQGQGRRPRRRHHLFPGTRRAGHLRARVSRGTSLGREARELPPRAEGGRRALVVSASVADARLLGIPHGVDGPRSDQVDLSGALHALPGRSRAQEAIELEGVGVPRRRRDRRTRDRSARSRWPRARSSTT